MKKFYLNIAGFLTCILIVLMLPLCIYMGIYLDNLVFKIILSILIFICITTSIVIIMGNIPGGFIYQKRQEQEKKIKKLEEEIKQLNKNK